MVRSGGDMAARQQGHKVGSGIWCSCVDSMISGFWGCKTGRKWFIRVSKRSGQNLFVIHMAANKGV